MEALRDYARVLGLIVTEIKDTPDRMKVWEYGCEIDFLLNDLEAALTASAPATEPVCDIVPDILTCAKGLTSGYLPLSATIIS